MGHLTADPTIATAIIVVKTGILVLGGLITFFSFKAFRRTGSQALKALSIGFGIITFGALLAGAFDVFLNVSFSLGVLIDATLTLVGFAVITYSLYVE